MGKYEELKEFPEKQFRRLTGVKRDTFEKMVSVLIEAQQRRYRKAGRKGNLSIEDKLLMALEYLREYRTYFHLGRSYGLRFNLIAGIHNYGIKINAESERRRVIISY